jgi:hypothetical protein
MSEPSPALPADAGPSEIARTRLHFLVRFVAATLFAVALCARWNGVLWAEPLTVAAGLAAVCLLVRLGGASGPAQADLWPAGFFSLWLILFAGSVFSQTTAETPSAKPLPDLPARKVLHAYGPLSVVVDSDWGRLVQPPAERQVLIVTDGVALTFSAEPYLLDETTPEVVAQADEYAQGIGDEEGFRLLESWDGSVDGSKTAERVLVKGAQEAYCLLVVTDRDGVRVVARADTHDAFGDRDVVGELRRIAASLRAAGEAMEETPNEAEATQPEDSA